MNPYPYSQTRAYETEQKIEEARQRLRLAFRHSPVDPVPLFDARLHHLVTFTWTRVDAAIKQAEREITEIDDPLPCALLSERDWPTNLRDWEES